jgi:DNA mismatch repair protein MutL
MPIRELPKSVSSKIAAGEVVERPVSVVKELIENSIDANASEINIRVIDVGRTLIEVEDNGDGIPAQDAEIAIRRYATSKISTIEDLDHIRSLGFRGEALASIAAVSRFTLDTRFHDENQGLALTLEGGEKASQTDIGRVKGTKIRVENLFFNVPARKKFLKKDITEKRLVSELVARYALYYSQIRFSFVLDGKNILTTYGRGDYREILSKIYDLETAKRLLEINFEDGPLSIHGFTSPSGLSRSNRKEIIFFVNGRLVSDPTLASAVLRAYHGFLMVGRFPITLLFLTINSEDIDVNVHPTKAEIRFRDQGRVFSAVHSAVRKTISAFSPIPIFSPDIWSSPGYAASAADPAWKFAKEEFKTEQNESLNSAKENEAPVLIERVPLLRLIGQLGRMYLAAEGPDGLYLIDQHAAHERVLFEQMSKADNGQPASQLLLEPKTVYLHASLMDIYDSQKDILEKVGFFTEPFGPDAVKILAVPAIIQHLDAGDALMAALEADEEDEKLVDQTIEKKIISKICKRAAVKGGQVLSATEQESLIRELENCESPRTCPHGRPTMIHLSVDMLARQFGRLGSR